MNRVTTFNHDHKYNVTTFHSNIKNNVTSPTVNIKNNVTTLDSEYKIRKMLTSHHFKKLLTGGDRITVLHHISMA